MSEEALRKVRLYVEKEQFKGYDPYDTLLSPIPFHWVGKWGPILATQFQKRNPINIRPLMGINKGFNPKAMGLFLHAYSLLYEKTGEDGFRNSADNLFNWLKENTSNNYSGACWGYNFPWASPVNYLKPYIPSSVVTGIVVRGIHAYHSATKNAEAKDIILSSRNFIMDDLELIQDESGSSISYTPVKKDICYNASLLAAETLARVYELKGDETLKKLCVECVEFVVQRQHPHGRWDYSEDWQSGTSRVQTDFHQGYILQSIYEISRLIKHFPDHWRDALVRGIDFYRQNQFFEDGRSYWRVPTVYPVDIHNQSQGIITFNLLRDLAPQHTAFANDIAEWTCTNMQSENGAFHYKVHRHYKHKIPYIRWSQAWMMLALTIHLIANNKVNRELSY